MTVLRVVQNGLYLLNMPNEDAGIRPCRTIKFGEILLGYKFVMREVPRKNNSTGYNWWLVRTAEGLVGWVAVASKNDSTLYIQEIQ